MGETKGIAVSQIILLVLGILVLAVVAYLLYSNFVTTGGTISAEQCRAAATRACTGCSIAGSAADCSATFLDASGKQCASEGKIIMRAGSCSFQTSSNTYTCTTDAKINCAQYTGGTTAATTTTTNQCDAGSAQTTTDADLVKDSTGKVIGCNSPATPKTLTDGSTICCKAA